MVTTMTSNYKITTIKDGRIVDVPYETVKREVIAEFMNGLEPELRNVETNLTEVFIKYFGDEKVKTSTNMSEEAHIIARAIPQFTVKGLEDSLRKKFGSLFAESSYYQCALKTAKGLVSSGDFRVAGEGRNQVYINLYHETVRKEKAEVADEDVPATAQAEEISGGGVEPSN